MTVRNDPQHYVRINEAPEIEEITELEEQSTELSNILEHRPFYRREVVQFTVAGGVVGALVAEVVHAVISPPTWLFPPSRLIGTAGGAAGGAAVGFVIGKHIEGKIVIPINSQMSQEYSTYMRESKAKGNLEQYDRVYLTFIEQYCEKIGEEYDRNNYICPINQEIVLYPAIVNGHVIEFASLISWTQSSGQNTDHYGLPFDPKTVKYDKQTARKVKGLISFMCQQCNQMINAGREYYTDACSKRFWETITLSKDLDNLRPQENETVAPETLVRKIVNKKRLNPSEFYVVAMLVQRYKNGLLRKLDYMHDKSIENLNYLVASGTITREEKADAIEAMNRWYRKNVKLLEI